MEARTTSDTAERAWRLADSLMERAEGSLDPPRADVFVGEYCEKHEARVWEARAATYRAVDREKIDVCWYDCHARLIPASLPPGESAAPAGGVPEEDRSSPWECGSWSMDALERDAPSLAASLVEKHAEEAVFSRAEDFVECARFWDAVSLMEDHGLDATTVHAQSLVCRECGAAESGELSDHLVEHEMTIDDYRADYPAAPVTFDEAASLPPASFDW